MTSRGDCHASDCRPSADAHGVLPTDRRSNMKLARAIRTQACAALALSVLLLSASAEQTKKADLAGETVGAEPKSFLAVVGVWRIESLIGRGSSNVLTVDGRQWKEGQASAGLADKARALYGERNAEFLDRVQAHADFPYAVFKDVTDFRNGEITVRFE